MLSSENEKLNFGKGERSLKWINKLKWILTHEITIVRKFRRWK
jgi:hypothetical protein